MRLVSWLRTLIELRVPARYALAAAVTVVCWWTFWQVVSSTPPLSGGTILASAIAVVWGLWVWAILGGDE